MEWLGHWRGRWLNVPLHCRTVVCDNDDGVYVCVCVCMCVWTCNVAVLGGHCCYHYPDDEEGIQLTMLIISSILGT